VEIIGSVEAFILFFRLARRPNCLYVERSEHIAILDTLTEIVFIVIAAWKLGAVYAGHHGWDDQWLAYGFRRLT
jgi:hypothetical protein